MAFTIVTSVASFATISTISNVALAMKRSPMVQISCSVFKLLLTPITFAVWRNPHVVGVFNWLRMLRRIFLGANKFACQVRWFGVLYSLRQVPFEMSNLRKAYRTIATIKHGMIF